MSNTSKKVQLKRAFYMHKAGLNLSDDVKELLFPEKLQVDRDGINNDDMILEKPIDGGFNLIPQKSTISPFQINSTINTSIQSQPILQPPIQVENQNQNKNENENQASNSTGSIGSKLLMQFKKLHAVKGVERPKKELSDDENEEENEEEEGYDSNDGEDYEEDYDSNDENENNTDLYDGAQLNDGPGYLPVEIEMPIDQSGKILLSEESIQKSKKLFEENKFRKEKLKYILDRDPVIQVC